MVHFIIHNLKRLHFLKRENRMKCCDKGNNSCFVIFWILLNIHNIITIFLLSYCNYYIVVIIFILIIYEDFAQCYMDQWLNNSFINQPNRAEKPYQASHWRANWKIYYRSYTLEIYQANTIPTIFLNI